MAIRANFAGILPTYDAVYSANQRALLALSIQGSGGQFQLNLGSFFSTADGRLVDTSLVATYHSKKNVSYSFNPDTLACLCCTNNYGHSLLGGHPGGGRLVFMLANQACPPTLAGKEGCVAVIRQETGELVPLVKLFLATTRGFTLPPGSLVVISSATQLATTSLEGYIGEASEAASLLYNTYGGEVELLMGPPFLIAECECPSLLRGLFDMSSWVNRAQTYTQSLNLTWAAAVDLAKERGTGGHQQRVNQIFKVQHTVRSTSLKGLFISEGWPDVPHGVAGMPASVEEKLVDVLLLELSDKFGTKAIEVSVDRGLRARREPPGPSKKSLVIVGASNSERLANELADNGHTVFQVKTTSWMATPETVRVLENHVSCAVEEHKPDAVIYMLLDNSLFLGRTADGTTMRAKRGPDGIYHIRGDLVMAPKNVQLNIFSMVKPIFMAAGSKPLILMTPLPRYSSGPCCQDAGHLTNAMDPDFNNLMLRDLDGAAENYRRFLFNENIRRSSTFNPSLLYRDWSLEELWEDPVHPSPMVFKKMVGELERCLDRLDTKRKADREGTQQRIVGNEWRLPGGEWRPAFRGGGHTPRRAGRGWPLRGSGGGFGRGRQQL